MSAGQRAVAAARAQLGVRFRLHGRGAEGLDCVGLAEVALRAGGCTCAVPDDYPLRGADAAAIATQIDTALARATHPRAGDLLLFRAGPGQLHLGIRSEGGVIHADAGLRRVVERPGTAPWPLVAAWRIGEE